MKLPLAHSRVLITTMLALACSSTSAPQPLDRATYGPPLGPTCTGD